MEDEADADPMTSANGRIEPLSRRSVHISEILQILWL